MATRTHKRRWTVEEVLAMPWDGKLREVRKGQLFVTNSPVLRHERAVRLLADQLRPYAATIGAEMFGALADIVRLFRKVPAEE
jgi:Uma2 family endonuclease